MRRTIDRAGRVRKSLLLATAVLLTAPALTSAGAAGPRSASGAPRGAGAVSGRMVAAGLQARGALVRRSGGVTVERVAVPVRAGAAGPVWRVTVEGRFPARALRYVVRAGGHTIGYGIPTGSQRAVRTITSDPRVLDEPIEVRYEGEGVSPARAGEIAPAATAEPRGMPSPGRLGPLAVTRAVYHLGNEAFQPTDLGAKVELTADVHFPSGLVGGPYPLVLFMHGNHVTCFRNRRVDYRWPCRRRWRPLPNYAGYDYIARPLASHGFIVVSVSANGVNVLGNRVRNTGMRQRGQLLEKHLDLWRRWSTRGGGPFGRSFVGKVDLSRIGTMGHSRGGEGVVWHKIVDERRAVPYGIDAVLALAPVDFTRRTINETSFAVVLPYCDGDVFDLQGVHFFDDSRYLVPGDPTPKHTVAAFGANHNFFNKVWSPQREFPGGFDDGRFSSCGERLTQVEQRRVGRAYIVGFFRRYLGGELELDPMWTGAARPRSIKPARTLVSYLAPDTPSQRMDLARFTRPRDLSIGRLGAAIIPRHLPVYDWCANRARTPCMEGAAGLDIHRPGLAQGIVGWSSHAGTLRFEIPEERADVSAFDALQFRAALNPGHRANRGIRFQDLVVVLIDTDGNRAGVIASEVGNDALAFPRGAHISLNQVRFPLRRFEGVDLQSLRAVVLRFTRTRRGVINLADVAFTAGGAGG